MFNFKIETYFKIIFIISFISITSAYFIEYILGYQPCNLCLVQRIPYITSMTLIITYYTFLKDQKFVTVLLALIFIFSFLISFYHFGIEQGFFEESAVCGLKDATNILSKEDLLKHFDEKVVSCKDVTFRIFGLSLTSINMIISFVIVLNLIKIYSKYDNNK
tara:strand:- start:2490 stop:2975 length:486 start_codon:yes stop_codon:yes gene_type:complete